MIENSNNFAIAMETFLKKIVKIVKRITWLDTNKPKNWIVSLLMDIILS